MSDSRHAHHHVRKTRTGTVVSAKMDKTIRVRVERRIAHPLYGKFIRKAKNYIAHDETNSAREGDTVRIMETRPISKTKCWRLVDVVTRAVIPTNEIASTEDS